jgi:hypothetical protein
MAQIKLDGYDSFLPDSEIAAFRACVRAHVRHDWHEPDEQEITATVVGAKFDNAGLDHEKTVVLKIDRKVVGRINLATLCALATETLRREGLVRSHRA